MVIIIWKDFNFILLDLCAIHAISSTGFWATLVLGPSIISSVANIS